LLALLGACSILPSPKNQPVTQYELAPPSASAPAPAAAKPCPQVVRVRGVEANPPYATADLLYTQTPRAISSYAWHKWAASPATMLTRHITSAVSARGLYRAVLGPTDPGDADLTLAVRLDMGPLQVFPGAVAGADQSGSPQTSTEKLAFTATLTRNASGAVVGVKSFAASQDAGPTPYGGVKAAGELSGRLTGRLLQWLGGLAASCPAH